jgi:hypothetical protein
MFRALESVVVRIKPHGQVSWFSTNALLKKMIKPFVLKCHPDMAQQQGLPKTAQKVNLRAIQNLNSYVDGVVTMEKGGAYPFSSHEKGLVEIEFVMAFQTNATANAAHPTTSRRRVELQVPGLDYSTPKVASHVHRQIVKLLRMADLPIPAITKELEEEEDEPLTGGVTDEWLANQAMPQTSRKTPWDVSRERFRRKINWRKFDELYEEAWADAQANIMTRGMIRNNPKLRKELLAKMLSNIHFTKDVQPLERLVAYRRLLRLLDENFDYLHLEESGKYYEEMKLVVTSARPYNISSSAMRKRRQRQLETGYSFTIHLDNSVTVQIPVDFRDAELIQELYRNVGDFYAWTNQGFGMESLFESA